jgi:hypothetical protein
MVVHFDPAGFVGDRRYIVRLFAVDPGPNLYAAQTGRKFGVGSEGVNDGLCPIQDVDVFIDAIVQIDPYQLAALLKGESAAVRVPGQGCIMANPVIGICGTDSVPVFVYRNLPGLISSFPALFPDGFPESAIFFGPWVGRPIARWSAENVGLPDCNTCILDVK